MNWNCALTEERLSDFLEGALRPEEAAAFSAHKTECEDCASMLARVGALVEGMHRTAFVQEPSLLVGRILAGTVGPRKPERASRGLSGWLSAIFQPRFAMGAATVAASFIIVFHAAGPKTGKTDMNPLNLLRAANRQAHLTYARSARFVNDLRFVYEIESRLESQPEPMSEPSGAPAPSPRPGEGPQSPSAPQDKSQKIPHSDRREARHESEWALSAAPVVSEIRSDIFSRSLL